MVYPELDARKQSILKAIVQKFIVTGKPVSSKAITESYELGVSSATIRNEMAALEKMGLIYQPHTSAGRIPTDTAYRYYVDMLMDYASVQSEEARAVELLVAEKSREIETLLREVSLLLSNLTRAAAMVLAPFPHTDSIKHVDLVKLNGRKVVVIVITMKGEVGRRLIVLDRAVRGETVEKVARYLNDKIQGRDRDGMRDEEITRQAKFARSGAELMKKTLDAIHDYMGSIEERVFIGGTANIVREMDKTGAVWVQMLLEALEKQYFILDLLKEIIRERRLTVRIGEENQVNELRKFAFIGTSYPVAPGMLGSLGVVGPKYMDYARAIGIVDYFAKTLGRKLMGPAG